MIFSWEKSFLVITLVFRIVIGLWIGFFFCKVFRSWEIVVNSSGGRSEFLRGVKRLGRDRRVA